MMSSVISRLNDRRDAATDLGEDAGFTLIELMVVLLILAILLAIAIPTFLGVTGGANDRAAQSNLNTALTTAKTAATQNSQSYTIAGGGSINITYSSLASNEPSLSWTSGSVSAQGPVSVFIDTGGNGVVLESYSKSTQTCWVAVDNLQPIAVFTSNGPWTGQSAGGAGTAALAPATIGTYYNKITGVSSATGCNAGTPTTPVYQATWGTSYSNIS
jgi:type IV pilus assembly protein PilA